MLPREPRRPGWDDAREILGDSSGAASEVFVVGLPMTALGQVMDAIEELPALEVLSVGLLDIGDAAVFDDGWARRMRTEPPIAGPHMLISARDSADHLQIYVEAGPGDTLDVELVFWNDFTFPPGLDRATRDARLSRLVELAERCRAGYASAVCVLSEEHNADPRALLGTPGVVVW